MSKREELENNFTKAVSEKNIPDGFIKVTDNPVSGLNDQQKVLLNRKANELYNQGKYNQAERIYVTTGYSDGLTRIGEKYQEKNEYLRTMVFSLK